MYMIILLHKTLLKHIERFAENHTVQCAILHYYMKTAILHYNCTYIVQGSLFQALFILLTVELFV